MVDQLRKSWKYKVNVIFLSIILSCQSNSPIEVEHLITADRIYICNEAFDYCEAMIIQDGKILATGTSKELNRKYKAKKTSNFNGFVYPGFIDAHSHFYGYGKTLTQVDLKNSTSLEDVIQRTYEFAQQTDEYWIHGRGWDQTDWTEQGFPNNMKLSLIFPDRPVILRRVDGHAALANNKALEMAGIDVNTRVDGGSIEIRNGQLTGILVDNAADLVLDLIPEPKRKTQIIALQSAEKNCYAAGLTTVTDAGLDLSTILLMDSMHKNAMLQMKIYTMAKPSKENFDHWLENGIYRSPNLVMRSFKLYADGALGSRGAHLKEEYCDEAGHHGFWLTPLEKLDSFCTVLYDNGFQVNTHCIGDSANKKMLEFYAKNLGGENDLRWRIEHAQVVTPEDRELFTTYNIIPSVQPTHATSDMRWAEERLCRERLEGAYAYKSLLATNNYLPLGTDFPVESIYPLHTFHAAVFRTNAERNPIGGFLPNEALSAQQALLGITLWAAKASFMEDQVGSLEVNKDADFVVLNEDLMTSNYPYGLKVKQTWTNGVQVYKANW
ncbi:MAG: amidohydrolase [Bacteroidia bacterium]